MTGGPRRILIVRLSAIGDVIVTTPVSRALRSAFPEAFLAWVVEPRAAEILEANPYLDEVIPWDRKKGGLTLGEIRDVTRVLRSRAFDTVLDFQGLLRSALVSRLSGARQVIGNTPAREYADRLYHTRVAKSQSDPSSRQRCLDLLRPLGVVSEDRRMVVCLTAAHREAGGRLLEEAGVGEGRGYVCLAPGTTWPQKHWFEDRWAELARRIRKELELVPVVLGGPGDREAAVRISSAAGVPCGDLTGRTSLLEAAAVLKQAAFTVAVDTGLMHLSAAMETPTVALCGASWFYGFQDYARLALVREPLPCSPCLHRPTCGGRYDCMLALTPRRVLEAALALWTGTHAG